MSESFFTETSRPDRVVQEAARKAADHSGAHLLYLSGTLTEHARQIGELLSERCKHASWLIVCGAGVITERGEVEGQDAAAGLVFGTDTYAFVADKPNTKFGQTLAEEFRRRRGSSAQVYIQSDRIRDDWLTAINDPAFDHSGRIFGGGVLPNRELIIARPGQVESGAAAALIVSPRLVARVMSSSACRLISPLGEITEMRGASLVGIDGAPALDRLGQHAVGVEEGSLILVALGEKNDPLSKGGRRLAIRAIEGVDPNRGAIVVGEDLSEGDRVGFAVRDAHASRRDFESHLRTLARTVKGGSPSFGLYCCCAGRGHRLYVSQDVDSRLIKRAFPKMPLLGLHSTFEVAPLDQRLVPQIFAGVLAVFTQPS